jgi:hypothetical protein
MNSIFFVSLSLTKEASNFMQQLSELINNDDFMPPENVNKCEWKPLGQQRSNYNLSYSTTYVTSHLCPAADTADTAAKK